MVCRIEAKNINRSVVIALLSEDRDEDEMLISPHHPHHLKCFKTEVLYLPARQSFNVELNHCNSIHIVHSLSLPSSSASNSSAIATAESSEANTFSQTWKRQTVAMMRWFIGIWNIIICRLIPVEFTRQNLVQSELRHLNLLQQITNMAWLFKNTYWESSSSSPLDKYFV